MVVEFFFSNENLFEVFTRCKKRLCRFFQLMGFLLFFSKKECFSRNRIFFK